MKFLTGDRLGKALKAWRLANKWKEKDIVEASKKNGRPVAASTISLLENEGRGVSIDRLFQVIFPAYGIAEISDFDLFLDYCFAHSLKSIVIIRVKDRDIHNLHGTKEHLVAPNKLADNRSRISIIEIDSGKSTVWQNHTGHEFLMVSKGTVHAEFAETSDGEKESFVLKKGDAVAFPSVLYHRFSNPEKRKAELTIARPTKSLPFGMYGPAGK